MPNELIVHPGDLITADLWNQMLELIASVDRRLDANEAQTVPDLVGELLATARDEIARAQLGLATVLDLEGTTIADPGDRSYADRIVLAQMPAPEDRVRSGRRMSLLISGARIKKQNAPDIAAINGPGGNALVGKELDIFGTGFAGKLRVTIRVLPLADDAFRVIDATHIRIDRVPPFDGEPAPGDTKEISVTVGNELGEDSMAVRFSKPADAVARPVISNVFVTGVTSIDIEGSALSQTSQRTRVLVNGEEQTIFPRPNSISLTLPKDVAARLRKLDSRHLEMLMAIDRRNLFMLDSLEMEPDIRVPPDLPGPLRPGPVGPIPQREAERPRRVQLETRGKMFLILSPNLAAAIDAARDVRVTSSLRNTVTVAADRAKFTVDLAKLTDVLVEVTVGDQKAAFVIKMGEIS